MDDFTDEHLPTDHATDPLAPARGILNAALAVIGIALFILIIARPLCAMFIG